MDKHTGKLFISCLHKQLGHLKSFRASSDLAKQPFSLLAHSIIPQLHNYNLVAVA
jgi:hypothetical protein